MHSAQCSCSWKSAGQSDITAQNIVCARTQLRLTLATPMACSPPGSSARGILQARILEWLAFLSPGNLPNPGIEPGSPALQADSLPYKPPGKLCFSLKAAVSLPPSPPQPYTIASRLTPSTIMPIQRRSLGLTRQRGQGFLSGLFADISLVPRTHAWHMAGSG